MTHLDQASEGQDVYSLRGRVFRQLRADILSGKYKDNEELRENTIAKEYGVSRTPVREAIRQLELEGLVVTVPNKGAYVNSIKRKDVEDIYAIRALLEGLCARWATEHITQKEIEALEEVILLSEFYLKKPGQEQARQVAELDGKFHKILYEASNSRILEHVLSDFHKYVKMARTLSVEEQDRAVKSVEEHREILEAIRNKDAGRAEALADRHIRKAMENLRNKQEEESEWQKSK